MLILVAALASACAESTTSVTTGPSPAKCEVSLTGTSSVESAGGAGNVTVSTQPECVWTATASATWITGLTPTTGQGSGRIDYRVAANPNAAARDGDIVVNDGRLRVTQQAAPTACTYSLAPATQSVVATGGTGSVTVTTGNGCLWSAASSATWLTLTPANGSATGTLTFTAAANPGAERLATITVAGQQATVRQSGAQGSACAYEIEPAAQSFAAAGGAGSPVAVTTTAGCAWTARTTDAWITVTGGASGTGSGTVSFTVAANTGAARTGSLTIAGAAFRVSQAAPVPTVCSFTIAPTSQSIAAAGGAGTPVAVTAGNGCSWAAASNVNWITVTGGATGSGNGSVAFTVAPNTATDRSGTLTIAGHTFTVNQAAAACTVGINPTSASPAAGATTNQTVAVTTNLPTCTWTATSNATAWLTISAGASGTGSGTVTYNVAANTGPAARIGALTIGGQVFTVTQATCSFTIAPTSANVPRAGGTGAVTVTANGSHCTWTATRSPTATWLTITSGASGTGSGTVNYTVSGNGPQPRTGTLTVAGLTFTVNQAGN